MKISRKGEYALRAMIFLSLNYRKGPVHIQEISQKEKITKKFLEQILLELRKAGLLQSQRGAGGGYYLIKPPEKVTMAQVIRTVDGPLAPVSCVSRWAHVTCPYEKTCGLKSVMQEVRDSIAAILEGITFAEICRRTKGSRQGGGKD